MTDVRSYTSVQQYLKSELARRMGSNPRYSLRSFARDLRTSPQFLSYVLNGKRGLSLRRAVSLSERLGLSPEQSEHLYNLAAWTGGGKTRVNPKLLRVGSGPEIPVKQIELDTARLLAEWYHFTLYELVKIRGFRHDSDWIAKRLGITPLQAQRAWERLIRLGLIKREGKRWVQTEVRLLTSEAVPSYRLQLLEKAGVALEKQSRTERDFSTVTLAVDPKNIPAVRDLIRDFRRNLMTLLEQGEPSEVYCFSLELFRLTEKLETAE